MKSFDCLSSVFSFQKIAWQHKFSKKNKKIIRKSWAGHKSKIAYETSFKVVALEKQDSKLSVLNVKAARKKSLKCNSNERNLVHVYAKSAISWRKSAWNEAEACCTLHFYFAPGFAEEFRMCSPATKTLPLEKRRWKEKNCSNYCHGMAYRTEWNKLCNIKICGWD